MLCRIHAIQQDRTRFYVVESAQELEQVALPAPFGPTITTIVPAGMKMLKSCRTAFISRKRQLG